MKVIANKSLYGKYGQKQPGDEFEVDEDTATQLLAQDAVRHAKAPRVEYETKVITPAAAPQVSAREPFRHPPLLDAQSEAVDSEGHTVLTSANIFPAGTTDPVGRSGRSGSGSRR